ncbi:MAG: hypothetical protein RBG13Loki_3813 [Promethearchaeota archaeon CR_4]|nr:MAG: hypothetical protein RBG13Loki_3813 [Candidatus Lokiarchaeota archaeon CR_4]
MGVLLKYEYEAMIVRIPGRCCGNRDHPNLYKCSGEIFDTFLGERTPRKEMEVFDVTITLEETLNEIYNGFEKANVQVADYSVTGTAKVVIPGLEVQVDVDLGMLNGWRSNKAITDRDPKRLQLFGKIAEKAKELFEKLQEALQACKPGLKKFRVKLGFKMNFLVDIEFSVEFTIEKTRNL